jgi:hypothetical protein
VAEIVNHRPDTRLRACKTRLNSSPLRKRAARPGASANDFDSSGTPTIQHCYGMRWRRPLARRALRTLRPPSVFIRARNPCVRARRILEG